MKIFITKSDSFIGKNLVENLKTIKEGKNRTRPNISISEIYEDNKHLSEAEIVIILPGTENVQDIIDNCEASKIIVCFTEMREEDLKNQKSIIEKKSTVLVYRFPIVVGKWQKPDKDTAIVEYLCDAVANDVSVNMEEYLNRNLEILFVDDFIEEILDAIEGHPHRCNFPNEGEVSTDPTAPYDGNTPVPNVDGNYCYSPNTYKTSVECIIENLKEFNELNTTSIVPEIPQRSLKYKLYSVYLSYLPVNKMSYPLKMNVDNRGVFTELVKTVNNGQVSINIARPGIVRGQHWHNNKWEIFIVVSGHGLIQERRIGSDKVINFEVRGEDMRAVIMLPGYAHNIINLEKDKDLVTVMWANEQFDNNHPDTFFEIVDVDLET